LVTIPSGFCFGLQHVSIDLFKACEQEIEPYFLVSKWSNGDFEKLLGQKGFSYSYSWLGMFSRKLDWYNLKMSLEAFIRLPILYWHFVKLMQKQKPDILFFANHHELILLLPVLWFVKTPVVCHMHDPAPSIPFQQKTFAWYGKTVNQFITISNDVKKRLMLLGCAAEKITVVHNGIVIPKGVSKQRSNDFVVAAKWTEDVFIVGITGQMTQTKGHEDVLAAFEQAYSQNNKLRLVFGGKQLEPMFSTLKKQIALKGLENVVYFSGWLTEASSFYSAIDLFILASRHDEGYGLVVAEAMANLRPVIITRSGGAAEIVEHNVSGVIVEKRDTTTMGIAILKYANDQAFYNNIQQNGFNRIVQSFSLTKSSMYFTHALKQTSKSTT
jgi:glycosyltransferase involved in cell wall biosynthesis